MSQSEAHSESTQKIFAWERTAICLNGKYVPFPAKLSTDFCATSIRAFQIPKEDQFFDWFFSVVPTATGFSGPHGMVVDLPVVRPESVSSGGLVATSRLVETHRPQAPNSSKGAYQRHLR